MREPKLQCPREVALTIVNFAQGKVKAASGPVRAQALFTSPQTGARSSAEQAPTLNRLPIV